MDPRPLRFVATASHGEVSALLVTPPEPRVLLVLAHGAGAGMEHRFLARLAQELGARGVATLRYQFPYTEAGARRPDPPGVLEATVRAAVAAGRAALPGIAVFAGGKSMGGRMTSRAAASAPLGVQGIVFLGFPLHPAGAPSLDRAAHLGQVPEPMLFLQGTRDALADLGLIRAVVAGLPRATLHVVEGADHGFHVLKRSGRDDDAVLGELAEVAARWTVVDFTGRKT